MLFNSFPFVGLVLATLALFYAPPFRRLQTAILIGASFVFYAYSQPWLLSLLVFSIVVNAGGSYLSFRATGRWAQRAWMTAGVVVNLLVLFSFKYGGLAAATVGFTPSSGSLAHQLVTLPLPIGISFYTFQGISLLVDVYRQRQGGRFATAPTSFRRHLVDTAFFTAFFPQLVAGPIMKAHDLFPQIRHKRFRDIEWEPAFRALVLGYFLKIVIADNLKDITVWIEYPYFPAYSTLLLLTSLFGYSMQIFADFAGYSLIALGTAELFGYKLMVNFNYPYVAQSLSEFWRRWHISLSTWLREYLYIPLGGNRRGTARTYFNLILVMTLGGLWHGAAWTFALWGFAHGCGLALERAVGRPDPSGPRRFSPVRLLLVFTFVTFAWLCFKLPNVATVLLFLRCLRDNWLVPTDPRLPAFILLYCAPVVAYHALHLIRLHGWRVPVDTWRPVVYGGCLFALLVNSGSPSVFIYFQF
jgi:alginate O-acetyltransferase complex protein AlgI